MAHKYNRTSRIMSDSANILSTSRLFYSDHCLTSDISALCGYWSRNCLMIVTILSLLTLLPSFNSFYPLVSARTIASIFRKREVFVTFNIYSIPFRVDMSDMTCVDSTVSTRSTRAWQLPIGHPVTKTPCPLSHHGGHYLAI